MVSLSGRRLVIFGCGYVGAAVADLALAHGVRVTALTRNRAKATALRARGIETVVADLATDTWHEEIPGRAECVLNCVSSGGGGLDGYRRSYVDGMESILTWARQHGAAQTLVYTSSTSVYPQSGGVSVDETAPTTGASERGQVLLEAERRLRENGHATLRWFVLRLGGIYGPQREHLVNQVRVGTVSGDGQHHLNLIHRDDIVAAVSVCFTAPRAVANEIFNVVDDAPAPKAEVANWLAVKLGVPSPRFSGLPAEGRAAVTPDRVILNTKLKSWLGWQPRFTTFREGYQYAIGATRAE